MPVSLDLVFIPCALNPSIRESLSDLHPVGFTCHHLIGHAQTNLVPLACRRLAESSARNPEEDPQEEASGPVAQLILHGRQVSR